MICFKFFKVIDLSFSTSQLFQIGEGELARIIVPPNTVRILISDLETKAHQSNGFLKIAKKSAMLVMRNEKLFRLVNTARLAALAKHLFQYIVEVSSTGHLHTVHKANFDV